MNKKKKVEMPLLNKEKFNFKTKILVVVTILTILASYFLFSKKENEYVAKNTINNYVCQLESADPESGFFAVKCLTK